MAIGNTQDKLHLENSQTMQGFTILDFGLTPTTRVRGLRIEELTMQGLVSPTSRSFSEDGA